MKRGVRAFLLSGLCCFGACLPGSEQQQQKRTVSCEDPVVRKEWRSLSEVERRSYLDAVKCMMEKPAWTSTSDLPGVANHFEDFLGDHILQADTMHFVEIRECGFQGGQPYWDWTLDADSLDGFLASPIFDPETGFGGNGEWVPGTVDNPEPGMAVHVTSAFTMSFDDRSGGGCIPNGPFANMTIHMGPGVSVEPTEYCVRRDFTPSAFMTLGNSAVVSEMMETPDFGHFTDQSEKTIHSAGHPGVGGIYGTLTDLYCSPGDPLFFLHHANMDRAWWSWQSRDLETRLTDISGPIVPYDKENRLGGNYTLDHTVRAGTTSNVTVAIRSLMDIEAEVLCYTYNTIY
ncbi:Tyrosinase central domain protein [Colletotrichum higginsianum IMI 349063]|uniref:Tyrosinase central domain protein n=1 Tax=Colletotrichum higginsianum (strain IMI 349063) TaxID=759273 RepID=A0A1B7XU08_COLHI|nr:Tyrosinase central domain protein [Colletotrichum higginsianum IMI 349063]OBR03259.1 Tyrosinase central domain protein [Colletotrichum higginsianum IMI 349063]